jgi:hypothetical protein
LTSSRHENNTKWTKRLTSIFRIKNPKEEKGEDKQEEEEKEERRNMRSRE